MDIEKMKRWQEMAKQFYGKDFWNGIFDAASAADDMSAGASGPAAFSDVRTPFPPIDIHETPREIILIADIPGVEPDTLQCLLDRENVTLRGTIRAVLPEGDAPVVRERHSGPFERTVRLPAAASPDGAVCRRVNGILTVRLQRLSAGGQLPLDIRSE